MGILEFIVALVENLVWPLTVVLAIFVFRGPISNLLPFLQRLRYKLISYSIDTKNSGTHGRWD